MWLLIDIGNSASKVGLFDPMSGTDRVPGEVVRTARFEHSSHHDAELREFVGNDAVSRAGGVSVVPVQSRLWEDSVRNICGAKLTFFNHASRLPIKLTYRTPQTMGHDRIAAAVAGWMRHGEQDECGVIVIDAGTAINYEVILPDRTYPGGVIAAGPGLMRNMLQSGTAQLPPVDLVLPSHATGRTTVEAIQSGILNGTLDAVRGMVHRMGEEHRCPFRVVTTGGFGAWIREEMRVDWAFDRHLVLKGISDLIRLDV